MGEVLVTQSGAHCISIFSSTREKFRSFGSKGSGHGQFDYRRGVAVDDDGNILVVDEYNHRIQKFSPDGKFIMSVGKKGVIHSSFMNQLVLLSTHSTRKYT